MHLVQRASLLFLLTGVLAAWGCFDPTSEGLELAEDAGAAPDAASAAPFDAAIPDAACDDPACALARYTRCKESRARTACEEAGGQWRASDAGTERCDCYP